MGMSTDKFLIIRVRMLWYAEARAVRANASFQEGVVLVLCK